MSLWITVNMCNFAAVKLSHNGYRHRTYGNAIAV